MRSAEWYNRLGQGSQHYSYRHETRHERDIHSETGMAPQARWEAAGFLAHLPESFEQLDLLLLDHRLCSTRARPALH